MADKAHVLTDKEIEKMERHLSAIYSRAEKELSEKADKYFERFRKMDEEKRKLLDAGKITQKEYDTWRKNQLMTGRHWAEMKRQAAHRLTQADQEAADYINGRLPSVYALNYNAVSDGLETQLKGYSFELVDANTVRNLATQDKTLLPYKYIDGAKAERWHTQRVNAEVLQGILQGESIPKIARRLRDNVGMSARGSAVRNARTAVTSAENKGRMDMLHDAEGEGVKAEKGWLAAHDARVRESHAQVDGEFVGIDEEFSNGLQFPGDPDGAPEEVYNCRCTLVYKVVGFNSSIGAELQEESIVEADFTPVKNISEAEEYAKRFVGYGGDVSYKGIDVDYANTCNRVLTQVLDRFGLGTINSVQPMNMRQNLWKNSTSEAAYRWGSGDLFINPRYYKNSASFAKHKKEIDSLMQTVLDGGQSLIDSGKAKGGQIDYIKALLKTGRQCVSQSYDFVEGTFVHECGHMLDDKVLRKAIKEGYADKLKPGITYQDLLSESRKKYGGKISGYAVSNNQEYLAETFSAWWYGESERCDPNIISIIERLVKK